MASAVQKCSRWRGKSVVPAKINLFVLGCVSQDYSAHVQCNIDDHDNNYQNRERVSPSLAHPIFCGGFSRLRHLGPGVAIYFRKLLEFGLRETLGFSDFRVTF